MARRKLRIVFCGEFNSTYSLLHYAALRRRADVVLWVASRPAGGGRPARDPFRSARDLWERAAVRARLEWSTFRHLGRPVSALPAPSCPVRIATRNDTGLAATVEALQADLLISAGFSRILPACVLDAARLGALNCHPSPLPRYAGSNPWFWILRNGESEAAVTIHRMVAEADAGPVVAQEVFAVPRWMNHQDLYNASSVIGAALLDRVLSPWLSGEVRERPQTGEGRTYFPSPKECDMRVDWSAPASSVVDLVRAATPSPGAWTMHGSSRLALLRCVALERNGAAPGEVIGVTREGVQVGCGRGSVCITIAAPEGGAAGGAHTGGDVCGARIAQALALRPGERLQ